jgi:hypothetical protein
MTIRTFGNWEVGAAELRVKEKISIAVNGEPAGAIAVAYMENLIHLCNQNNSNDGFRRAVAEMLKETEKQIRRTLRP